MEPRAARMATPSMHPLLVSFVICALVEVVLAGLCWLIVPSVVGAILLSAVLFGPASLFLGPMVYAKLKSGR